MMGEYSGEFWKGLIAGMLVMLAPVSCGSERNPIGARRAGDAGIRFLKSGNFPDAASAFLRAQELDPGNAEYFNNHGIALLRQERFEGASASFERALRLDQEVARYHFHQGLALQGAGDADSAVLSFERAVALEPDYFEALAKLGEASFTAGNLARSETAYLAAIRLDPAPPLMIRLGVTLMEAGKLDRARARLEQAAGMGRYELAHYNLGVLYQKQKNHAAAAAEYRRAVRINPDGHIPYYNLGLMYRALGQNERAVASFESFLENVPPVMSAQIMDAREQIADIKTGRTR